MLDEGRATSQPVSAREVRIMGYWDDGRHMDGGWGPAMVVGMLAFAVLIAAVVALTVLWAARAADRAPRESTEARDARSPLRDTTDAEQILATRLARGEIDTEEYQARLDALRSASQR
jgi:putative membrane protein